MRRFELHEVETFIGNFLRWGVLACAAVIACGIALSFLFPGHLHPPMEDFLARVTAGQLVEASHFTSLSNPNSVVAVGLLMLIALPILRLACALHGQMATFEEARISGPTP